MSSWPIFIWLSALLLLEITEITITIYTSFVYLLVSLQFETVEANKILSLC